MHSDNDIFGLALIDYINKRYTEDIIVHSPILDDDHIPVPYLFRSYDEMPPLEQFTLDQCFGSVLDIGCCAGSHSLYLQKKGFNVTGIDRSAGAIQVSQRRGLKKTQHTSFLKHHESYDTIILLMNGTGIFENIEQLPQYLLHLKSILRPGGQVLIDSSDLRYLYEAEDGGFWVDASKSYYGEMQYHLSYKGQEGSSFNWLYLDYSSLNSYAATVDLQCTLLYEDDHYGYLAKLTVAE